MRNKTIIFTQSKDCCSTNCCNPTPNDFTGTDSERIAKAVNKAAATTGIVEIPKKNRKGGNIWLIDYAILLPSNITVILDNATIKLSDKCRDNFFRSANCGLGITSFVVYNNINIIGIGTATSIEKIEILWPVTGKVQLFENPPIDTNNRITEDDYKLLTYKLTRFDLSSMPHMHHH